MLNQAQAELAELAAAYRDARHTAKVATDRLHAAILAAVDRDGLTIPQVAQTIGVSKPRVYQILAATPTG